MANRFSVEAIFKAVDRITRPVRGMQSSVARFAASAERRLASVNRATKMLTSSMIGAAKWGLAGLTAGATTLTAALVSVTKAFMTVEDAQAAFTPLLGGAEKAAELVGRLNETAATTPFQFGNLADVAGQLLPVMNGNLDETILRLRQLGDTAGGNAQKLDSITRGFTKAMLKGKVDLEALNMIGEAGVPIFQELAAVMGTEVNEAFFDIISAGEIATSDLTKAFERMTSEGGIFFNGMKIASETTSGLWSTMVDNITLAAAEIGAALSPVVKELIGSVTNVAQRVREWAVANRELIATRAAEVAERLNKTFKNVLATLERVNILERVSQAFELIGRFIDFIVRNGPAILQWAKWIGGVVIAMQALSAVLAVVNTLMLLNPVGLLIAGLAALAAGITAVVMNAEKIDEWLDGLPGIVKLALTPLRHLIKAIRYIKENAGAISDAVGSGLRAAGSFLGLEDDEETRPAPPPAPLLTPERRTADLLQRSESVSRTEMVLRDETGRVEVSNGKMPSSVKLIQTGAF